MRRSTLILIISFLLIFLFSSIVLYNQREIQVKENDTTPVPSETSTETPQPSATLPPTLTNTPTITPIVVLEPPPVEINFSAEDGQLLSGIYYPADTNPAPLVVLVHWARGDQTEWTEIALWLQNRSQLVREPNYNKTWRSSDWFPENTSGVSLGIFTFTLRECEDQCKDYLPGIRHC